ncbi:hypothetical protein L208DRAFT_1236329, partial [Tricholoma matsutake]
DVIQHKIVDGCSWVLNRFEVSFLESCIKQQPYLTLLELQEWSHGTCGMRILTVTIHCALRQQGLSCKKVML